MENDTASVVDATESAGAALPQLDGSHFANQIFWLLVALFAIYFILSRIALPRIASVLAERSGTITNDLAAAEELRLKASLAEEDYERKLAEARAEAGEIVAQTKASIQGELADAMAKADAEISARAAESARAIEAIKETAAQNVHEVADDVAAALLTSLGGDPKKAKAAVKKQLKG